MRPGPCQLIYVFVSFWCFIDVSQTLGRQFLKIFAVSPKGIYIALIRGLPTSLLYLDMQISPCQGQLSMGTRPRFVSRKRPILDIFPSQPIQQSWQLSVNLYKTIVIISQMQTPPSVHTRHIYPGREGRAPESRNPDADYLRSDVRLNSKLIQKKELFASSANKEDNVQKMAAEMRKNQTSYIDNTNWMFENGENSDCLYNFSINGL